MNALTLPALGYQETVAVEPGATEAKFNLPDAANGDATASGTIRYAFPAEGEAAVSNTDDREILQLAVEREWLVVVSLPSPPMLREEEYVRRIGNDEKLRNDSAPFRIVRISKTNDDAGFVVLVAVEDMAKTFSIINSVKPNILRIVREDFQARNPNIPAQTIRERLKYEIEDDGKYIVFTGWAFSVRPTEDGWSYDPATRRGWMRLAITGDIAVEAAKQWALDNIAAIVADKNSVIEAGKTPPLGATFNSLGESFENDVLTVEFEVVQ